MRVLKPLEITEGICYIIQTAGVLHPASPLQIVVTMTHISSNSLKMDLDEK
jgi:hypothetical protein